GFSHSGSGVDAIGVPEGGACSRAISACKWVTSWDLRRRSRLRARSRGMSMIMYRTAPTRKLATSQKPRTMENGFRKKTRSTCWPRSFWLRNAKIPIRMMTDSRKKRLKYFKEKPPSAVHGHAAQHQAAAIENAGAY